MSWAHRLICTFTVSWIPWNYKYYGPFNHNNNNRVTIFADKVWRQNQFVALLGIGSRLMELNLDQNNHNAMSMGRWMAGKPGVKQFGYDVFTLSTNRLEGRATIERSSKQWIPSVVWNSEHLLIMVSWLDLSHNWILSWNDVAQIKSHYVWMR